MPIYEYKCLACETTMEKIQKFSDPPLEICDFCGGRLEKQWSLSGFQFKGSGWYVTDYARKSNGSTEKATESSKVSACGSSECSVSGCASTN